jgi:PAS domain S-box-containing protein
VISILLLTSALLSLIGALIAWRVPAVGQARSAWRVVVFGLLLIAPLSLARIVDRASDPSRGGAELAQDVLFVAVVVLAFVALLRMRLLWIELERARNVAEAEGSASREAERLWRLVFEYAPNGYVLHELDGAMLEANRAAEAMNGFARDTVQGRSVLDLEFADDASSDRLAAWGKSLADGVDPGPVEYQIRRTDGAVCQIELVGQVVELGEKKVVLSVMHDVTESHRIAAELSTSSLRLAEAQRVAGLVTWELDFNKEDLWLSHPPDHPPGYEQESKPTAAGPVYQLEKMLEFVHPEDRDRVTTRIAESLAAEGPVDVVSEYRVPQANGEDLYHRTVSHSRRDEEGNHLGLIGASLDITEVRRAEREIRQLNTRLEERVRARTSELERAVAELRTFSYSVSHDLRSPLRAMAGYSELVTEEMGDALSDTSRAHLERIHSSSVRMAAMIDDLLSLARLTQATRHDEKVDLSALANNVAGELREGYSNREVEIRIQPGVVVCGDRGMLGLALQNLFSNAWKFTRDTKSPLIEFGFTETGQYFVRDNGVGFDNAHAAKLFRPFERLHRVDEFDGSGIGLATVARIIHRHGGKVHAEGRIGHGATFYFTLDPTAVDADPVAALA